MVETMITTDVLIRGYSCSQVLKLINTFGIVDVHGYVLSYFARFLSLSDMHIVIIFDREAYLLGPLLHVHKYFFFVYLKYWKLKHIEHIKNIFLKKKNFGKTVFVLSLPSKLKSAESYSAET